jgi:hypothetical protein
MVGQSVAPFGRPEVYTNHGFRRFLHNQPARFGETSALRGEKPYVLPLRFLAVKAESRFAAFLNSRSVLSRLLVRDCRFTIQLLGVVASAVPELSRRAYQNTPTASILLPLCSPSSERSVISDLYRSSPSYWYSALARVPRAAAS